MRLVIILFLATMLQYCTTVSGEKVVPVPIKVEKQAQPEPVDFKVSDIDDSRYKNKDVEIFKSSTGGHGFKVLMYRTDNGKLKCYQAFIKLDNDFSTATYNWLNDSTVVVSLWDNKTRTIESFNMIGTGNTTRLMAAE